MLPGPKTPLWCCQCGESNNWACRIRCKGKGCNRSAAQSVINKARAAAKQQAASGYGAWTTPCPTQSGRPSKERLECEALKKEIEAIKKAIKAQAPLQQMAEGSSSDEDASDDATEGAAKGLAARIKDQRARINKMERADQAIKDAWGAISWAAKVDTERAELAALQQQSREAKPLDVQLKGALQHRSRCERQLEQAAEAVEQTLREQAELATKLAAFKLASREATTNLATAEEECKRLQEWHAQRVLGPVDLPRVLNTNAGVIRVGPIAVTAEEAVEVQAVLDGMLGRIPPPASQGLRVRNQPVLCQAARCSATGPV